MRAVLFRVLGQGASLGGLNPLASESHAFLVLAVVCVAGVSRGQLSFCFSFSLFHITSAATEFCVKQQRFRCNGKDRVQCVMFAREEEDLLFLPVVRQRPYRRVPLRVPN